MSDRIGVSPRILVVEDEAVVQLALTEALRDLGFSVEPVGTAGAALERLHDLGGSIDAAIVDIGLPDRPGDALAVELRQRHVGLPIIIATGSIDPDLRQRFDSDPSVAFLSKPYDSVGLLRQLAALGVPIPAGTPSSAADRR